MREIDAIKVLNMIETHGALSTMAKDKSIEALEKQIPKKPVFKCKNLYMCVNGCEIHKKQLEKDCYCPNCGQKLDWSNKECNKSVYIANKSIDIIDAVNKGYAEGYNKAIDDFVKFANDRPTFEAEDGEIRPMLLEEMAERLKEMESD